MSGGSYNYLFQKEPSELLSGQFDAELRLMAERLAELGYKDAAVTTEELSVILRQVRVRIEARIVNMAPVWRAIEWLDSFDSGPESVGTAIEKWRNAP